MVRWYFGLNGRIFKGGVALQSKSGNGSMAVAGYGSLVSLSSETSFEPPFNLCRRSLSVVKIDQIAIKAKAASNVHTRIVPSILQSSGKLETPRREHCYHFPQSGYREEEGLLDTVK
nr:hypothetical protein CFP56_10247 [Quercus suber]